MDMQLRHNALWLEHACFCGVFASFCIRSALLYALSRPLCPFGTDFIVKMVYLTISKVANSLLTCCRISPSISSTEDRLSSSVDASRLHFSKWSSDITLPIGYHHWPMCFYARCSTWIENNPFPSISRWAMCFNLTAKYPVESALD